ncbi:MAG: Uma2 family endonuclease [Pseudomonadota bacterium]
MNLATEKKWTEADLMSLPDVGGKYELIEGEVLVTPADYIHDDLVADLISRLRPFVRKQGLGRIFASNAGYWMKGGNLRCPDVSFVTTERLADMIRKGESFLHGAPDLAIEVLSPSNTVPAMKNKAAE